MSPLQKSTGLICLCCAVLGAAPAQAQMAPPISYVMSGCGAGNGVYTDAGPAAAGLQLACDKQESGFSLQYGPYSYSAASSVNSGLGMGGSVDANASLTMAGGEPYRMWGAGAGGYVQYTVGLAPTAEPAPHNVAMVPVKFAASGEAHVTDGNGGMVDISASLDALSFRHYWEGAGSHAGAFSNSATVMFSPTPGNGYTVLVSAWCRVTTWSAGAGSGSCVAAADPQFSFDQAAFDASMGANSFQLDRYYRFEASAGVTLVPEPASVVLMGAGLGALAAARRRKKLRA